MFICTSLISCGSSGGGRDRGGGGDGVGGIEGEEEMGWEG